MYVHIWEKVLAQYLHLPMCIKFVNNFGNKKRRDNGTLNESRILYLHF